jgi:hypothetical protein
MASRVIDAHIHVQPIEELLPAVRAKWIAEREDAAWLQRVSEDPAELIRYLDRCGVERAAIINYPSPDLMGFTDYTNEYSARVRDAFPDRIIACGGVHPRLVKTADEARRRMDRLCEELKISMIKLHPPHQGFQVDDYQRGNEALAAIFEKAGEFGVPVMIHTGTSMFPGARSRLGDPMPLDDVCLDFPKVRFILSHLGRPLWADAAFFLLRRHANLSADCSGIPPKTLLQYFPRLAEIGKKVLFGTDWPSPGVKDIAANIDAFRALPLPPEVRDDILYHNAARMFR